MNFTFRYMEEKDIETIYENIHLEYVKKYFNNQDEQKEIHRKWYKYIISSRRYLIHLVEEENNFVAMVSYEIYKKSTRVGIFLNKNYRAKKYSKKILNRSLNEFKNKNRDIKYVLAYVLEENIKSQKLFLSSNFSYIKNKLYDGVEYRLYRKKFEGNDEQKRKNKKYIDRARKKIW